jgi:hypothetical protein
VEALKFWFSDCAIKGALIVAPKWVTCLTWPDEITKWGGLTFANLRTDEGMAAWNNGTADCYLINYDMLQQFTERGLKRRKKLPADVVVWDEISKAKSHESVRIKSFLPYRHLFKKHIGLSGTPQPNSCLDLWAQIRLLDGGRRLGDSFHRFRAKYAESDYMGYKWAILPGSDDMVRDKIRDMMLCLRSEDWMDIPPVTVEDIEVTIPPEALRKYRVMEKDFLTKIGDKEVAAQTAAALVQKLMQFGSGAVYHQDDQEERGTAILHDSKVKALAKLHKSIGYKPLLVFNLFKHEVPRILKEIPYAEVFDGSRLDDWNAGKIKMWIAHPASMGHGIQCQGTCHHVCWFTLGYSNELYIQGNARVARTGQKNPTMIYRLISNCPIDWAVAAVLRSKEDGQSALKSALSHLKVLAKER